MRDVPTARGGLEEDRPSTRGGHGNTRGALWVLFIMVVVLGLFYASHEGSHEDPARRDAPLGENQRAP